MTVNASNLITFADAGVMANRVADAIVAVLEGAIAKRGKATMALSGGSTPAALYKCLSCRELPWGNVTATLVDERWVAPGANGSNEQFVNDTLAQNNAKQIRIVGMWNGAESANLAVTGVTQCYAEVLAGEPFDVIVMGMGPDGHSASWFPGASNLEEVLTSNDLLAASTVPQTQVTGSFTERMTLTPSALCGAGFTCLLLKGDDKKDVFLKACTDGPAAELPIRALLNQTPNLWACWTR